MMNMAGFYGFVENVGDDGVYIPPQEDQETINEDMHSEPQKLEYSRKWRGHFTREQIEALDDIYAEYEKDFNLDSVNIRDYARKVAKASLNADIAEDRMRRGEISASDYKEAQTIFDTLSKSAAFAASKKKPGETSGMGSLGEIISRIEVTGKLNTEGFHWPQDSVDAAISEYKHSLVAAGLEGAQ